MADEYFGFIAINPSLLISRERVEYNTIDKYITQTVYYKLNISSLIYFQEHESSHTQNVTELLTVLQEARNKYVTMLLGFDIFILKKYQIYLKLLPLY